MNPDENNQDDIVVDNNEGDEAGQPDVAKLQEELATLKATVGSTKRELKDAKKALEDAKKATETPPENQQSNEPDYARLAFLQSVQVTHPDDQKVVLDEATRLKLPLTDVLQMEHIKATLSKANDTRVAQAGMPEGSGRKGSTRNEVEYYLAHPEETTNDLELANKVIDAKLKIEANTNKFSSELYSG